MSSRFRGSTVILSVVQAIVLTVFPAGLFTYFKSQQGCH